MSLIILIAFIQSIRVIKLRNQLNNVEKAFKELAALYSIEKDKNQYSPIEIEYRADGQTSVKRILTAE